MNQGKEDEVWRVLVVPGLQQGQLASLHGLTLPEPRTGRSQGFLLSDGSLLEVNRFKQAHSAWLTCERLLADGGMFLATPYDPLFALLPLLDRARDKDDASPAGKFKELEELLYDAAAPGLSLLLQHARRAPAAAAGACGAAAVAEGAVAAAVAAAAAAPAAAAAGPVEMEADGTAGAAAESGRSGAGGQEPGTSAPRMACSGEASEQQQRQAAAAAASLEEQLACVCDVRKVDDTCYYRLNDQRVLAWLLCKFRQIRAALSAQVTGMDAAYASSYVLSFMAEYLGDPWVGMLAKHLGITEHAATGTALQPTDGNVQAAPRATPPPSAGPPEKKQKVDARAAAKQAALAKQAVGTKKLTSFFTKK